MKTDFRFNANVGNQEIDEKDELLNAAFTNSIDSNTNHFQVLFREHLQNSTDAFQKNHLNNEDKLIFKISRKKIDFSFADLDSLENIYKNYCLFQEARTSSKLLETKKSYLYLKNAHEQLKSRKDDVFWAITIEDNAGGLTGETRKTGLGKKEGTSVIVNEGDSDKDESLGQSKGTFGLGKVTAFTSFNDASFVVYVNRRDNKSILLGKARFTEFYNKETKRQEGKGAFLGKESEDHSLGGIKSSDWGEIPENLYNSLRTIKDDGLTTIIPILNINRIVDFDWLKIASFSVILSFFRLFQNNEIEVEIADELTGKNFRINNNNFIDIFLDLESAEFLNEDKNYLDKYNYLMVKPFVTEYGTSTQSYSYEMDINVNRDYKGKAVLKIFENKELDQYITEIENLESKEDFDRDFLKSLRRPVRIIRNDMLLRKFTILQRNNIEGPYSGYVYFHSDKEDNLNFLISKGEDPSHDDITLNKFDKIHETNSSFPSTNDVKTKFIGKLVTWIKEKTKELFEQEFPVNEEYDLEIDSFENDFSVVGNESFDRISKYQNYILKHTRIHNTESQKGNDASREKKKDGASETLIIPIPKQPKPSTPPKPPKPPKPPTPPKPPKPKIGPEGKEEDPVNKLLKKVTFLSKKVESRIKGVHQYYIKFENVDHSIQEDVDLFITQDSFNLKSILSFELKEATIDGKKIKNIKPLKHNPKDKTIGAYMLQNVTIRNSSILQLNISEPNGTTTHFLVSIKKSNNEPSKTWNFFGI